MNTAHAKHTQVDKHTVSLAHPPSPPAALPLTVKEVLGQVALIQQVMAAAMKDGEHYGKIPGCGDKPTLLKPGAEKLCHTFKFAPAYDVLEKELPNGHREYRVTTTLTFIPTQAFIGQGVGVCTTQEAKYRFRAGAAEPTDRPVPRAYWDLRQEDQAKAQELIGGKGFTVKKVEGQGWMVAKGGEKVEHDNPADHYNTVLKMAKKRALVDAVLTATAASDIFTQDLEDIRANLELATATAPAIAQPVALALPAPSAAADEEGRGGNSEAITTAEEPFEFRIVEVPSGKNEGVSLGMLTPEQLDWYITRWMPNKEGLASLSDGERLFIRGLRAYKAWREAGAATAEQS